MATRYSLIIPVYLNEETLDALLGALRGVAQELDGRYELEIVDVLEHPQRAEDERILATPTLIKQLPPPLRRVIGDLSDKEKVLLGLEVRPDAAAPAQNRPEAK